MKGFNIGVKKFYIVDWLVICKYFCGDIVFCG